MLWPCRWRQLRAHISETYRLHRRMIRHRRLQVTAGNDDDAALQAHRPDPADAHNLDTARQQLAQEALLNWQTGIANWLIDEARERGRRTSLRPGPRRPRVTCGQRLARPRGRAPLAPNERQGGRRRAGLTDEERTMPQRAADSSAREAGILDQLADAPDSRHELDPASRGTAAGPRQRTRGSSSSAARARSRPRLAEALEREYPRTQHRRAHTPGRSGGVGCRRRGLAYAAVGSSSPMTAPRTASTCR